MYLHVVLGSPFPHTLHTGFAGSVSSSTRLPGRSGGWMGTGGGRRGAICLGHWESWPLTVVMDGNSALPSVGLAGCLAQPCTPGWGVPCGAGLLFLWLGDQLLAPQDRRLAKGAKPPRTHSPMEGRAAYGPPGESEGKPWPLAVFLVSSQVLCEARSRHNFTACSLGIWHTCALCK